MTDVEKDRLLIEISIEVKQINRKLDRDGNALYGTDEAPGDGLIAKQKNISERVSVIENKLKEKKADWQWVMTNMIAFIAVIIAAVALFKNRGMSL